MTTDGSKTFNKIQFHTNCLQISPRSIELFGNDAVYGAIERHFKTDWGDIDDALKGRNDALLEFQVGIVESRFSQEESGEILVIESGFVGSWTRAYLLGEE